MEEKKEGRCGSDQQGTIAMDAEKSRAKSKMHSKCQDENEEDDEDDEECAVAVV